MSISCPHCLVTMAGDPKFCTHCGKALPSADRQGPRILEKDDLAASAPAQELQLADLKKQASSAAKVLAVLSGLQFVGAAIFLAMGASGPANREETGFAMGLGIVLGFFALIFLGLTLWARRNPLPAAITGLVLIVSLWALDAIAIIAAGEPEQLSKGIIIRIIIVAALAKAVSAGFKHRELRRRLQAAPAVAAAPQAPAAAA